MSSEKALRTRAAIIAAARGIILKEGIGALTMDRAAQAAGMSKGACMYHFKNKRALHAALIEDYAAHLDGQMKRMLQKSKPIEKSRKNFRQYPALSEK